MVCTAAVGFAFALRVCLIPGYIGVVVSLSKKLALVYSTVKWGPVTYSTGTCHVYDFN